VDASSILGGLAESVGVQVEVRTAHGPWFDFTPTGTVTKAPSGEASATPSGFSLTGWFLEWLKPQVIVRSDFGTWSKAPHGAPTGTSWPFVPLVVVGVFLLLLVFAGVGVVSLLRGK
jgi:hypothetical protein